MMKDTALQLTIGLHLTIGALLRSFTYGDGVALIVDE